MSKTSVNAFLMNNTPECEIVGILGPNTAGKSIWGKFAEDYGYQHYVMSDLLDDSDPEIMTAKLAGKLVANNLVFKTVIQQLNTPPPLFKIFFRRISTYS